MRWKGFILLLMLLMFFTAPVDTAQPAAGGAEVPRDAAAPGQTETPSKYVALTFDDGPRRSTTARLLDGLQERGTSATFFLIGQQIPGNEDLVRRMAAEGHQVGNHTYGHVKLAGADSQTILTEISKTDALLREVLEEDESYWLRPPYGLVDAQSAALVKVPMIRWSVDPEDWKVLNADKEVASVLKQVQPGDIILMHDFYPASVDAALRIIDQLQAQGYTFVTVKELFALYGTEILPGGIYASPHE